MINKNPKIKEIIDLISSIDSSKSNYDILTDFITMYALDIASIFNNDYTNDYLRVAKQYTKEQLDQFAKIGALLIEIFEENPFTDILTIIYMKSGFGNKNIGQDFTPNSISSLTSNIIDKETLEEKPYIIINEPSCGAGAMILKASKKILDYGYNPTYKVYFIGQDIDYKCGYMTYIQMVLNGIAGEVIIGDTLHQEVKKVLYTPMALSDIWKERKLIKRLEKLC